MTQGQPKDKMKPPEEDREPTKRVVLKRERVLVLAPGTSTEAIIAAHKATGAKGAPNEAEAWVVVGEFVGISKDKAIEAHAGKPNTPDAKVGAFKAPTASAWSGGALYKAPPKPLVEREAID